LVIDQRFVNTSDDYQPITVSRNRSLPDANAGLRRIRPSKTWRYSARP
jgi:hypothetical protein